MRVCKALSGVALLLAALAVRPARAATDSQLARVSAIEVAREIWGRVQQAIAQAQPGALTVELDDLTRPAQVDVQLRSVARTPTSQIRISVPSGQARTGDFTIGSDETLRGHLLVMRGDADIYGKLFGNLVTVDGDVVVHPGAAVSGDVLALRGEVRHEGGKIGGDIQTLGPPGLASARQAEPALSALGTTLRNSAGVLGVFITLAALGFALVMFARPHLEVVSDTAAHSFGRSLLTGILVQFLLIPTFGMLVVGLILSVVGILLLPFVVIIYSLLVILAIVGGFLAVAHAMGETYTRRRLALGIAIGSANSYRYLLVGLVASLALWAAWALFGWVPVAGSLIGGAAMLVTWLLGTAGLGATLLSRAGLRENFAGRLLPADALTDEYLWATPQMGVTAARRAAGSASRPRGSP